MVMLIDTRTSLYSERNVVVAGSTGDGCGLEIAVIDGDVAALGGPVARKPASTGGILARAQELHRVGNDIGCLALCAVLGLPLAPLEPPVDRHRTPLGQVAGGVLALRAPHGDVEVVGLVLPLARSEEHT